MKPIKLFFAKIRRVYFNWRINREIFHRISPHLRGVGDYGYSFHSNDEFITAYVHGCLNAHLKFDMIEPALKNMPKFQGDALRYIIYRDLNERMKMYLELVAESATPESPFGRFRASRAQHA